MAVRCSYDLYENDEVKQYAQYTDLETLYKECDIITLHAPATEDNYHMIGTEHCKDEAGRDYY